MPMRREDGRAVSPPKRSSRTSAKKKRYVLPSGPRGDAPTAANRRPDTRAGGSGGKRVQAATPPPRQSYTPTRGDSPATRRRDFARANKYNEGSSPSVKRRAQYFRNHSRAVQLRATRVTETKAAQRNEQKKATIPQRRIGPTPQESTKAPRLTGTYKPADPNLRRTQAASREVQKDIKRVYTKGDSLQLKDKTDAAARLREKGIFAPIEQGKPKKPTYIAKDKPAFTRVGGTYTKVEPDTGETSEVHGNFINGKFFERGKRPINLGAVAKAVVGAVGDYFGTDTTNPHAEAVRNANKAIGKPETSGLSVPEKVEASLTKTASKGLMTGGSVALEALDRPVAAVESAILKGVPTSTGRLPGLVDLPFGNKKLKEKIRKARGPGEVFLRGRDWKKDVTGADVAQSLGLPRQAGIGFDLGLDPTMYVGGFLAPFTGGASIALVAQRIGRIAPKMLEDARVVKMLEEGDRKGLQKFMKSREFKQATSDENRAVATRGLQEKADNDLTVKDHKGRDVSIHVPSRSGQEAVESALRSATARQTKAQPRIGLMTPLGRRTVRGRELPSIPLTPDLGRLPARGLTKAGRERAALRAEHVAVADLDHARDVSLRQIDDAIEAARVAKRTDDLPALRAEREALVKRYEVLRSEARFAAREGHLGTKGIRSIDDALQGRREANALHAGVTAATEYGRMVEHNFQGALEKAVSPATRTMDAEDAKRAVERVQLVREIEGGTGGAANLGEFLTLTPEEQTVMGNLQNLDRAALDHGLQTGTMQKGLENYTGMRMWNDKSRDLPSVTTSLARGRSNPAFVKHRSINAMGDLASREQLARAIQRLADKPVDDDTAWKLADQVWERGQDRTVSELVARRLQRGEEIMWGDLTPTERRVVYNASVEDPNLGEKALFSVAPDDESTEGRVLLANPEAYGMQTPEEILDGLNGDDRIAALALSIKLDQQQVAALRASPEINPAYAADLDTMDDIYTSKLQEIGLPGNKVEHAAAPTPELPDEAAMRRPAQESEANAYVDEAEDVPSPGTGDAAPTPRGLSEDDAGRLTRLERSEKAFMGDMPPEHKRELDELRARRDTTESKPASESADNEYRVVDNEDPQGVEDGEKYWVETAGGRSIGAARTKKEAQDMIREDKRLQQAVKKKADEEAAVVARHEEADYRPEAEDINTRSWYHGSGTADLTAKNLDGSGTNIDNLFGQGVYLTDDADIARGYAKARSKGKESNERIYTSKIKLSNPLDMEAAADPRFRRVLEGMLNDVVGDAEDLRKLTDATNDDLYRAFVEAMKDHAVDNGYSKNEMMEYFQELAGELKRAGWDAITHIGGKRVGNKEHQVVILLDPADTSALGTKSPVQRFDRTYDAPEGRSVKVTDEAAERAAADELPPEAPPSPPEPEDRFGRLPDYRARDDKMIELDPRVTGYYRARGQGMQAAFTARWKAVDSQRGRAMTDSKLIKGRSSENPYEQTWFDKETGEEYVSPHSADYFEDRIGMNAVPKGRVWPRESADLLKRGIADQGEYDQIYDAGMDKAFQKVMGMIRFGVTTPFPAYHVRNIISDALKSLQADSGVLFHPIVNAKLAMAAFGKGKNVNLRVPGMGKMKVEDAMFIMDMFGVKTGHHASDIMQWVRKGKFDEGNIDSLFRKVTSWGRPGGTSTKFGASREDVVRFQTFMQRMRANQGDAADAAFYMIRHHFNYNDLAAWEKRYARNLFLFYTWYRKNIPLQFMELLRRPGFFSAVSNVNKELEQGGTPMNVGPFAGAAPNQPALPDYVKDRMQAATVNWNGFAMDTGFGAPWGDLNWMSGNGLKELPTMLNPLLGVPLQLSLQTSLIPVRTFKQNEPSPLAQILQDLGLADFPKDNSGKATVPWALNVFLRQIPIVGRASSSYGELPPSQDQGRVATWARRLGPVTGLNISISPKPGSSREAKAIEKFLVGRSMERREMLVANAGIKKNEPKLYDKRVKSFDAETLKIARQRGITKYLKNVKNIGKNPKTGENLYESQARGRRKSGPTLGGNTRGGGIKLGG